jgi:hypothetical protein
LHGVEVDTELHDAAVQFDILGISALRCRNFPLSRFPISTLWGYYPRTVFNIDFTCGASGAFGIISRNFSK